MGKIARYLDLVNHSSVNYDKAKKQKDESN